MTDVAPVIAIDGPTGSGKGTVSRRLARHLNWHLLDSGALYRLVAVAAEQQGVALEDRVGLTRLAAAMQIRFAAVRDQEQILLEGKDVTAAVRTEERGREASQVGAVPEVRKALLERQRQFARPPGLVADGRDMGSVVFPTARLKVFLTADPAERAARRYKQLKEKGIGVSLARLSRDIVERDERDAKRPVAPLQPAPDARVLDSTKLNAEQVVERILAWAKDKGITIAD